MVNRKNSNEKHNFSVQLDADTAKKLTALVAGTGLSRGAIVRILIRQSSNDKDLFRQLFIADTLGDNQ